ncbi:hypothetical protein KEQ57_23135 [Escherichia coli]|nr:hypothetical protein [Escherichia coli]
MKKHAMISMLALATTLVSGSALAANVLERGDTKTASFSVTSPSSVNLTFNAVGDKTQDQVLAQETLFTFNVSSNTAQNIGFEAVGDSAGPNQEFRAVNGDQHIPLGVKGDQQCSGSVYWGETTDPFMAVCRNATTFSGNIVLKDGVTSVEPGTYTATIRAITVSN